MGRLASLLRARLKEDNGREAKVKADEESEEARRLAERADIIRRLKATAKADELLKRAKPKGSQEVEISGSPRSFEDAGTEEAAKKEKRTIRRQTARPSRGPSSEAGPGSYVSKIAEGHGGHAKTKERRCHQQRQAPVPKLLLGFHRAHRRNHRRK